VISCDVSKFLTKTEILFPDVRVMKNVVVTFGALARSAYRTIVSCFLKQWLCHYWRLRKPEGFQRVKNQHKYFSTNLHTAITERYSVSRMAESYLDLYLRLRHVD
jgi:hypothetical protein